MAGELNVAITVWVAFIVTVQVPVPEHPPPLQPAKVEGGTPFAVSVTVVLSAKSNVQVEPQSMPVGELVTVPVPEPALLRVRVLLAAELNVAVTVLA